jgi:hypothetical protein
MVADQATRKTKPCKYCREPMDVQASVCPHCQRETLGSVIRGEVRTLVLQLLVLLVVVPVGILTIFWSLQYYGKHMFDGIKLPAHAQPAHQAKPKAH